MRKLLITFILYVYTTYVYEDFSVYKQNIKWLIYIFWFYYATCVWIISPIFIPEFLFKQSNFYKKLKELKSKIKNN